MHYLRTFLGLIPIICLIPLLIISPIILQPYKFYIWIAIISIYILKRKQVNEHCLIILITSFLTFLFLSCQIWTLSRRILIGLTLIIGIILMIIICSFDYTISRHLKHRIK